MMHNDKTPLKLQPRSSLRMRYLAEIEVLKRQYGTLEEIRAQLGMSRRKLSQALMVDPSAWTRWVRAPHSCPPHVYLALTWYLRLRTQESPLSIEPAPNKEKAPASFPLFWKIILSFNSLFLLGILGYLVGSR